MPTRVQRILDEHDSLVFPGVFDTLSAKIAERAGFPLAFISGYAVSATLIGEPDMGLLTQTEVIDRARHICRAVAMPIIVDAGVGFGDAVHVALYEKLEQLTPSPVVRFNRAVALAMDEGAEGGLAAITELETDGSLRDYHLLQPAGPCGPPATPGTAGKKRSRPTARRCY